MNSAAAILFALAGVFAVLAVFGIVRTGGVQTQHRTWLLVAAIFAVVAAFTG